MSNINLSSIHKISLTNWLLIKNLKTSKFDNIKYWK